MPAEELTSSSVSLAAYLLGATAIVLASVHADAAMVVIALFANLGALLLLWSAVISASRAARSWLAPLPAGRGAVIRAFLLPASAVIVAAGAMGALLLLVFNVSYGTAAQLGACTALIGCLTVGGVLVWNFRPRRTP